MFRGERSYGICLVESITFEVGSKLQEIQGFALSGCTKLQSICIPASVEQMNGTSFTETGLINIEIENGNRHFEASNYFVKNLNGLCRYFGTDSEIEVHRDFGPHCFSCCDSLQQITMNLISSIAESALTMCNNLQSVIVPSSVLSIETAAFRYCPALRTVSFCADSKLKTIANEAFCWCESLESATIPSSLEVIGSYCFACCVELAAVAFQVDPKLVRIEDGAFTFCRSLKSFFLPSLVEFVGERCFWGDDHIATLTFGSPSHVRELLSLPLNLVGVQTIPDSIEILSVSGDTESHTECILEFGPKSRLRKIVPSLGEWRGPEPPGARAGPYVEPEGIRLFLQASTRSLKVLRRNLEFEADRISD
jgi:hypothetical protein